MKFLVDAQLPPALSRLLMQAGHDVIHTLDLPQKNNTPDLRLLDICRQQERVFITKDSDFLETYLLKREPAKLLFLTTGNISNQNLCKLFEKNLSSICSLFSESAVIEMNQQNLIVHFHSRT